jgi:PIN domain nuclease of toxin-antitoxin system
MNLLLDTHVLIWSVQNSPRLGTVARNALIDPSSRLWVSAASIWEISIKVAIGRLLLADPLETWIPRMRMDWGVKALHITFDHAVAVRHLPLHHADPFDRMLVAQAQCENLMLMTSDHWVRSYNVRTIDASV